VAARRRVSTASSPAGSDLLLDGMSDVMVGTAGKTLHSVSLEYAFTHKPAINPEMYQLSEVLAL
jgi:hypothetical protein